LIAYRQGTDAGIRQFVVTGAAVWLHVIADHAQVVIGEVGRVGAALLTGAASLLATLKSEKLTVRGVPVAGKELVAGPIKDLGFAFALLGRILDFYDLVALRTHADRQEALLVRSDMSERLLRLKRLDQVKLTYLLQKAHKGLSLTEQQRLAEILLALMDPQVGMGTHSPANSRSMAREP
jgi:hypothetical protein